MPSPENKWFANRGQVLQIIIGALALILALIIGHKNAWNELMGNHFVSLGALLLYALVGLVIFWLFIVWRKTLNQSNSQRLSLNVQKLDTKVSFDEGAVYKLKVTKFMRNASGYCINVRLLKFVPDKIRVSAFPRDALQVKHARRGWEPEPSDEEVHVRHGDHFRAWITPESGLSKQDVERSEGRIGTLVLLVNDQELPIQL